MVITLALHFIGRLRWLKYRHNKCKRAHLNPEVMHDLSPWISFLDLANKGISINLVLESQPNSTLITDSCEYGIGGFSIKTGRAFRFKITEHLQFRVSNNMLEHLDKLIAI